MRYSTHYRLLHTHTLVHCTIYLHWLPDSRSVWWQEILHSCLLKAPFFNLRSCMNWCLCHQAYANPPDARQGMNFLRVKPSSCSTGCTADIHSHSSSSLIASLSAVLVLQSLVMEAWLRCGKGILFTSALWTESITTELCGVQDYNWSFVRCWQ